MINPKTTSDFGKLAFSVLIGACFLLLLTAHYPIPGGDDAYRHARFASRLIGEPAAALADPWRLDSLWPQPVDAWLGFHVLLAPFTMAFDPVIAIKTLTAIIMAAIVFVLLAFLADLGAVWKQGWVLLAIAGSGIAFHRAGLSRPFLFSLFLVLLAALLTLRNRPVSLALVSAAHALSYSVFFLVALGPGLDLVLRRDRNSIRNFAACLGGLATGLLANPFFPENLYFDTAVALAPLTIGVSHQLEIGGELRPLNLWWIVSSIPVVSLWAASVAIVAMRWRSRGPARETLLLLAISIVALAASVRASRTFDYFVPFATLFAAAVLSPAIRKHRRDALYLAPVLAVLCAANVLTAYRTFAAAPSPERFRGASEYLKANGSGRLVFNTRWQQYPMLYFWNPESSYVSGIEPTFFYLRNARQYWLWRHIANDEVSTCDRPLCEGRMRRDIRTTIEDEFGAAFVLVERDLNPRVLELLGNTPGFHEAYRDAAVAVFAVTK